MYAWLETGRKKKDVGGNIIDPFVINSSHAARDIGSDEGLLPKRVAAESVQARQVFTSWNA